MQDMPQTKKSLGQHWLNDGPTLDAICDAADLQAKDTVLEIGPGTGTLTRKLVEGAGQVIAVELDQDLAKKLVENLDTHKLKIIQHDILKFDFDSLPAGYKIVANIPYYLTSNLIRVLSETPNPPELVVLLIQKEVAERIAAQPGDMSLLSVSAQFYWEVRLDQVVKAEMFTPPPKVDSQVIILIRRTEPLFPDVDTKKFFRLVKAGFAARRKTLANSLAGGLRTEKQQIENILNQAQIEPSLRAQTLSLDDWHRLYRACVLNGIL